MDQTRSILIPIITLFFFFVFLFGFFKLLGPLPLYVNSVSTSKTELFTVTGEGKVSIKPDIAFVNVGVSQEGPTVKAAQDKINIAIDGVTTSLKKLGIEATDIKTQNYNINPKIDYGAGHQTVSGYQAQTNIEVKVKKLELLSQVIDGATASGANQVGGIRFDTDNRSQYEDQVRKEAVEAAQKKAQQAAATGGFSLGKITSYNEGSNNLPITRPYMAQALTVDSKEGVATTIEPGSLDVTLTVTLGYEIH